ncbi:hypothetical protein [Hafnia alvei]|jgi:hypothetical protein|uniref:hypothetical protein n=1 Tax=Hafnia alvei TaxID=569 RepID=UPI00187D12B0|nr:hypothetical protein [Hafnia alvei]
MAAGGANRIILFGDVKNGCLRGQKFFGTWAMAGILEEPVICNKHDNYWQKMTN